MPMKLDVSATRHPRLAAYLLVSVQDPDGPVEGLGHDNFRVHLWASQLLGLSGISYSMMIQQVRNTITPPTGFYEIEVAGLDFADPSDEGPQILSPDQLGALVYAVVVRRAEDQGEAIAVTPRST
jgi:hypothetical protein